MALDDALGGGHFPQARNHARVIALRADGNGLTEVASGARGLMVALEEIRPERPVWTRSLDQLNFAIDRELDAPRRRARREAKRRVSNGQLRRITQDGW